MTDKMTVHPLKQMVMGTFSIKVALAAFLSINVLAQPANAADQQWWFDVEVIIFERNLDGVTLSENFKQSRLEQPPNNFLDLLTPYIKPDLSYLRAGLAYCRASNQLVVKNQYEQDFAFPVTVNETSDPSLKSANTQTAEGLVAHSDVLPEENFEYEVATTDIFSQSNDQAQQTQTTDAKGDSGNLARQKVLGTTSNVNLPSPPIEVEFIEWQVPDELPCVYAEQVDPSFASISSKQNTASVTKSADYIERVPVIIDGKQWQQNRSASLLPTSSMHMSELYDKIKRQRDITPILHVNWRQQVNFGRKNAQTMRLFAGENFADQFDANGLPLINATDRLFASLDQSTDEFYIPEQELAQLSPEQQQALFVQMNGSETFADNLFAKIDAALADDTPINIGQNDTQAEQNTAKSRSTRLKEIWQLDGGITVYLRNIGRIPYLHIDSSLDFRQPIFDPKKANQIDNLSNDLSENSEKGAIAVNSPQQANYLQQPNYLQSASFNQLRRVISKQVHYFDHPLFGMLVIINRYRWPEEPNDGVE